MDRNDGMWDDPVALAITEATGVRLQIEYPQEDGASQISLMLATSNLPDLIYAKGACSSLIENGALIDMSDLIEEYGPNIKKLYGDHYDWLRYSSDDPAIYQLCSLAKSDNVEETNGTVQLQFSVLAENGYDYPKTLPELETMLKDYLEKYPQINGAGTIGLTLLVSDWRWLTTLGNSAGFIANGSPDNGQWIVAEDGTVTYKFITEGQRDFFAWLNRMYNEGILDPNFATQTHEEYIEKLSSGRVLSIMDAKWDYTQAVQNLVNQGMPERTYARLPLTISEEVPCRVHAARTETIGWGVGITTSCADPVAAVKFLDFLCSDEGQVLLNWGIEGQNYYIDADGRRARTDEENDRRRNEPNYSTRTGVGLYSYPFPAYSNDAVDSTGTPYSGSDEANDTIVYNAAELAALEAWGVDSLTAIFPEIPEEEQPNYPPLWSQYLPQSVKDTVDCLDSIAWTGLVDCIICSQDQFEAAWQKLQSQLTEAGAVDVSEEVSRITASRAGYWNK